MLAQSAILRLDYELMRCSAGGTTTRRIYVVLVHPMCPVNF
jgi:hypothetical protein